MEAKILLLYLMLGLNSSGWINPTQEGENLTIQQCASVYQVGDTLTIE